MTNEESGLLTQTASGTPCGELMRRYWQPAALSEELRPGGAPLPVRLLGEDLVLFRDGEGCPGLLGLHCSHRGADLSYGRVEDGGLRCIYHGWLYDIRGRCLDRPGEPGGGEHRDAIRHPAYPCHEQAGVIFAYMGPGEPPLFPNYEFLIAPSNHRTVEKYFHECNYLQANEGNIDLSHLSFLHYMDRSGEGSRDLRSRGEAPEVETADAELTPYGVRSCKIRCGSDPSHYYLYITEFVLPNLTANWGRIGLGKLGYTVNWHVPIDDTHHWKYVFSFRRDRPLEDIETRSWRGGFGSAEVKPDYTFVRNKDNRYLQDRESMRMRAYAGLGACFPLHDNWATEGQGPIQERTQEHLVSMDRAVVAARKFLWKAIRDLQEGREPANVVRDPERNRFLIISTAEPLAASKDWREHCKELEAQVRV